jgi:hypothetical protein
MTDTEQRPRPLPTPTNITQEFWDAAKQKRLLLQYDPQAEKYQFYPRGISLYSGKRNLEWRESAGKGCLYSYTETVIPTRGFEDLAPYLIGLVELDEGVRLMALLHNCSADDVEIGMRVRLCWDELTEGYSFFAFEPDN